MSNDKNVWFSELSHKFINVYSIGSTYDGIFDYQTYRNNELQMIKEPDNQALKDENSKMWQALRALIAGTEFKKPPIFPDSLWLETSFQEFPKEDEYIFWAKGTVVLNQDCAEIFKQFCLGTTDLIPVKIYELETGRIFSNATFYILNLSEHHQYLTYPQSSDAVKFLPYPNGGGIYTRYGDISNQTLEVSKDALQSNVDLWHDPLLDASYFFSDKLHHALRQANMIEKFNTHFCKIV